MRDLASAPRPAAADLRDLVATAWRLDSRRVATSMILLALQGVTSGVSLALLLPIIRSLDSGTGPTALGPVPLPPWGLPGLLGTFVALTTLSALITRAALVLSASLQHRIVDHLRQDALDAVLHAQWSFVVTRRRSDVIEMVTQGAARSGMAFQQLSVVVATALVATATAAVAVAVSPALAAPGLAAVGILGALLAVTSLGPAHRLGHELGDRSRRLQATMANSLDSLRLVRTHDAAGPWSAELGSAFTGARETQLAMTRRTATMSAVSAVGLAAAASVLILVAVEANVPTASIVVVLALVARLAGSVRSLVTSGSLLLNALPAVGNLAELTRAARAAAETPPGSAATSPPRVIGHTHPLVELRDVSYTYPASDRGVHALTFTVPRDRVTALAGPSGAGKSTTADLVLGLLTPDEGTVLVDGKPLTPAELSWWRRHVAYVPQETTLIDASLRRNLLWSIPRGVSDDECWDALERCQASFVRNLPEGLDTMVGERGIRLSGGERQRIALARALLRRPTLLVLDEATSALDEETEAAVTQLVTSLVPAVTVLVIAHRRSTLEAAHHVVRIVDGVTT